MAEPLAGEDLVAEVSNVFLHLEMCVRERVLRRRRALSGSFTTIHEKTNFFGSVPKGARLQIVPERQIEFHFCRRYLLINKAKGGRTSTEKSLTTSHFTGFFLTRRTSLVVLYE